MWMIRGKCGSGIGSQIVQDFRLDTVVHALNHTLRDSQRVDIQVKCETLNANLNLVQAHRLTVSVAGHNNICGWHVDATHTDPLVFLVYTDTSLLFLRQKKKWDVEEFCQVSYVDT